MESVTPPQAFGKCFVADVIRYLYDTLGAVPFSRSGRDLDNDIADGRFTLFFGLPEPLGPWEPTKPDVKFITDKLKAAGWDIHWPKWDDDSDEPKHVLEISLSIDDMHRSAEAAIVRARRKWDQESAEVMRHLTAPTKRARKSAGDDTTRVQTRIRRQEYRLRAEKLREEYIQTRECEFNDPQIVNHMEEMHVRYPEWYNAIRQLNEDALETDRSWWEEKREETLIEQWDCKVIMWVLDDMQV